MGEGSRYSDRTESQAPSILREGPSHMVERRSELTRRYHRKKKMAKLKAKLARTQSPQERDKIVHKIRMLSPFWEEPVKQA
jgi:hypothetical protein